MKLAYTHPSIIVVTQAASALEAFGIKSQIRNEYAAGAIGELAPIDAWPELWVQEGHWQRAQQIIEESQRAQDAPEWTCAGCSNKNPASFELCWHCAAPSPASTS